MNKCFAFLGATAVVVVISAVYQGFITDRWANDVTERLNVFTERLEKTPGIPKEIGSWVATDTESDEAQFRASGCHGKISRIYENTITGDRISVYFVSGKAYHVTIHTPDWCYVAAGYEMENDPRNYEIQDVPGMPAPEMLTAKFKKVTPTETTQLRILWSYTEDGKWTAPGSAKYAFVGKPALYKVYFIRSIEGVAPTGLEQDPIVEFAREFLPVANAALFPDADFPAETAELRTPASVLLGTSSL